MTKNIKNTPPLKEKSSVYLKEQDVPFFDEVDVQFRKTKTPYILIGFLIFAILASFWKIFMRERHEQKANSAQRSAVIEKPINSAPRR